MRIIFDLRSVGLGNNGGSSTIVKSANTLINLGHEIIFVDSVKNKHTWNQLKAKHIIPKTNSDIPSSDFIIATGYKSVRHTVKSPERLGIKLHWIRGWETWQMPESKIVDNILKAPTKKLVNSICLQRKLKSFGSDSKIIRPGYDLNEITPTSQLSRGKEIILGGLNTKGKHWKIKRTKWIFDTYEYLKRKNKHIKLWMFGNEKINPGMVDRYFLRPTIDEKNYFYNNVDVWLSPAMQEGLHMPPAEAMMTECPVVGTNADMSGTEDYLIDGYNGFVSKNNFQSFLKNVEILVNDKNLRNIYGKNARKKIENIGDRETNMKKLIKYLMEL